MQQQSTSCSSLAIQVVAPRSATSIGQTFDLSILIANNGPKLLDHLFIKLVLPQGLNLYEDRTLPSAYSSSSRLIQQQTNIYWLEMQLPAATTRIYRLGLYVNKCTAPSLNLTGLVYVIDAVDRLYFLQSFLPSAIAFSQGKPYLHMLRLSHCFDCRMYSPNLLWWFISHTSIMTGIY